MPPVLSKGTRSPCHGYRVYSVGLCCSPAGLQRRHFRDYLKCMLVFKCLNNLAPPYLLNEFSYSRDFHSYNTRHRDLLRPPLAKTTKYQGSFRFSGTKIWNSLPLDLRRTHDLNKFKSGLKKHLRSS